MANEYEGLMDDWKLQLIVERAKRKGFREHEIEDAQQEVVLELLGFRFDPEKSNGATERTVITALIDKKLTFILRGQTRRQKFHQRYKDTFGLSGEREQLDWSQNDKERKIDLREDMKVFLGRLDSVEQSICTGLAGELTRAQIADELGISRYRIDVIIDDIAEQMRVEGFDRP